MGWSRPILSFTASLASGERGGVHPLPPPLKSRTLPFLRHYLTLCEVTSPLRRRPRWPPLFSRWINTVPTADIPAFSEDLRTVAAGGGTIDLKGLTVAGQVDLSTIKTSTEVRLRDCTFQGNLRLSRATIGGGLWITGCVFEKGLDLSDTTIEGTVDIRHTRMDPPDRMSKEEAIQHSLEPSYKISALYALRSRIRGEAIVENATLDHAGLNFNESVFDQRLSIRKSAIRFVSLNQASIRGHLRLVSTKLHNSLYRPIDLEASQIDGSVFIESDSKGNGCDIRGCLDFRASIRGSVIVRSSILSNSAAGVALDMEGSSVRGSVIIGSHPACASFPTKIRGAILLQGRIGGSVVIREAEIVVEHSNRKALNLNSAVIDGSVAVIPNSESNLPTPTIVGGVDLRASVGGQVRFSRARVIKGIDGVAIDMDSATVGESVHIKNNTTIEGAIDLRCDVGGYVYLSESHIHSDYLSGGRMHAVFMSHASVTKDIIIESTIIDAGMGGVAVKMESISVDGFVQIRSGSAIIGEINGSVARIGGFVVRTEEAQSAPLANGISPPPPVSASISGDVILEYSSIDGPFVFNRSSLGGRVVLRHSLVRGDVDLQNGVSGEAEQNQQEALFKNLADTNETYKRQSWSVEHDRKEMRSDANHGRAADGAAPPPPEVDLRMARIGGRLWLKGQRILGAVDLEDAKIAGEANFDGGEILGDLLLRSAEIIGRVFGDEASSSGPYPCVHGKVDARGAKLSEIDIHIRRATDNPVPKAILLDDATARTLKFRGDLGDNDDEGPFRGRLLALMAEGRRASIWAFNKARCTVHVASILLERLLRPGPTIFHGLIVLAPPISWLLAAAAALASQVAEYSIARRKPEKKPVPSPPRIFAHNLAFEELVFDSLTPKINSESSRDALRSIAWGGLWYAAITAVDSATDTPGAIWPITILGLAAFCMLWQVTQASRHQSVYGGKVQRLMEHSEFSPAFYIAVEKWLHSRGDDRTADNLFLGRRRREMEDRIVDPDQPGMTRGPEQSLAMKLWRNCVLDFLLGYGVRPMRAVHLFFLLLAISWGVFLQPKSVERPVSFPAPASNKSIAQGRVERDPVSGDNPYYTFGLEPGPAQWDAGQAFFMALRVHVPILELAAESDWQPSDEYMYEESWGQTIEYENYAAAMQVVNLILIPLLVAGATGFLKRKE